MSFSLAAAALLSAGALILAYPGLRARPFVMAEPAPELSPSSDVLVAEALQNDPLLRSHVLAQMQAEEERRKAEANPGEENLEVPQPVTRADGSSAY